MSPFKKAAVKRGGSKGKELVIEVDDFSTKTKRTRSLSGVFDPNKFRSYAAFQTHKNYLRDATPLLERPVDQFSLHDTEIPQWFAQKDWNYLLSDLDEAYENLVKEFYANAIVEGEELKCWVRRYFTSTGRCLKTHQFNGNSVSVSSLPPKLRVLTIVMFHKLVPLIQHWVYESRTCLVSS